MWTGPGTTIGSWPSGRSSMLSRGVRPHTRTELPARIQQRGDRRSDGARTDERNVCGDTPESTVEGGRRRRGPVDVRYSASAWRSTATFSAVSRFEIAASWINIEPWKVPGNKCNSTLTPAASMPNA